jgi:5-methyltetrahydropteroyltriglutamate--homocysteine methyltransferase
MGRHLAFPELSTGEFLKIAEANVEALNHALRDIPADRMRLHLCWGNYEGPHHRDIPLRDLLAVALNARPQGLSFEGANPRHEHGGSCSGRRLPGDKIIILVRDTTSFIEHPGWWPSVWSYAEVVGRERVIAAPTAAATFARSNLRSSRRSLGEASGDERERALASLSSGAD